MNYFEKLADETAKSIKQLPSAIVDSFQSRLVREGMGYTIQSSQTNIASPAVFSHVIPIGRAIWIPFCNFQASVASRWLLSINVPTIASDGSNDRRFITPANYLGQDMGVGLWATGGQVFRLTFQDYMNPYHVSTNPTGDQNVSYTLSASAQSLTADFNYSADHTILFLGDSITHGSSQGAANSYNESQLWTYMVRDYFLKKGYNVRHVNMSVGGTTLKRQLAKLESNKFDVDKVSLIFVMFGTNDMGESGTTTSTYSDNLQKAILKLKDRYTSANIIVMGSPSLQNSGNDIGLNEYRVAAKNVADFNANKGVSYIDLSQTFPAGDATYFYNDGIHPNTNEGVPRLFLGSDLTGSINGIKKHLDSVDTWM